MVDETQPIMSNQTLQIRPATLDDLETIVSFNVAMAEETEGKKLDREVHTEGARLALTDKARSAYYLAEIDGRIAGQTMVTFEWSDWRSGFFWWIQSVYVHPDFRRQGVFKTLYQHIQQLAKSKPDVCGIRLYVYHKNKRAIETYQHLGMTLTDYLVCEEEW